jgi:hypothetical protein
MAVLYGPYRLPMGNILTLNFASIKTTEQMVTKLGKVTKSLGSAPILCLFSIT